jgi:hypothetical protein
MMLIPCRITTYRLMTFFFVLCTVVIFVVVVDDDVVGRWTDWRLLGFQFLSTHELSFTSLTKEQRSVVCFVC